MNPFINRLKEYSDLSTEAEEALEQKIQCFHKKKDDFLLKQGQVISGLFLLEKGLVRAYFIKKDKEVNAWFGMENMFIGSILPLYTKTPSFENIQFLEDAIVYSIAVDDLNELYKKHPELNIIGRKLAEELCVVLEERITSLHTESAEERYQSLIRTFPDLLQRINLGHIASFLGITQETLSRIRKR
jgi:CRP-like cAMP-binding protein